MDCCGSGSREPKQNNNNQKDHSHGQETSNSQSVSNNNQTHNFLSIIHWVLMLGLAGYFLWRFFN